MHPKLLEFLACPQDKALLRLLQPEHDSGELKSGELACTSCGRRYPVVQFIPRFVDLEAETDVAASTTQAPGDPRDPQTLRETLDRLYASTLPTTK